MVATPSNTKETYILGLSAYYHDSAAALLCDGEIVAAAHEERFTRKKHDAGFPTKAVEYCLEEAGVTLDQVQYVVFYEKPFIKLERLLETYLYLAPRGVRSFISAAVVWIQEKFFMRSLIKKELGNIHADTDYELLFSDHHLSHAASAFYPSPFESAAILTIDGVGEWTTTLIAHGKVSDIRPKKEIFFPHSIGLLYSAFTYYLGFRVNSGEYKLMGLAPYGNHDSKEVRRFIELIKQNIVTQHSDGSYTLNQDYFNYATGLTMTKDAAWSRLFGFDRRVETDELEQKHCDLALAIQTVTEELVLELAKEAKRVTGESRLVLAGGVALNCVCNRSLKESGLFEEIWAQPAAGDAGTALGAAQAVWYRHLQKSRLVSQEDTMQGAYLGPAYSDVAIGHEIETHKMVFNKIDGEDRLAATAAEYISKGNVVGWFQGRMEWGPRALGARSILGDPRNPKMQKQMNLRIKYREGFRPFAPSVLAEHAGRLFTEPGASPYMLFTTGVQPALLKPLPDDYHTWSVNKKLYYERSSVPAVTHIDYSARHQTVHQETNPRFHKLINAFYKLTDCPAVINTSFNVRGEPIVCTPYDAIRCFMTTEMDYLVIGSYILRKADQTTAFAKPKYALD